MIWLISDTHIGHGNILVYGNRRPFVDEIADLKALYDIDGRRAYMILAGMPENRRRRDAAVGMMRDAFVEAINELVSRDDVLVHAGDLAMSKEIGTDFAARLNVGTILLVKGNHDRQYGRGGCWHYHQPQKRIKTVKQIVGSGFRIVHDPSGIAAQDGEVLVHGHWHDSSTVPNGINITPEALGHYAPIRPEDVGLPSQAVAEAIRPHLEET